MDPLWPGEPAYGYARNGPVMLADRSGKAVCSLRSSPCDKPGFRGGCIALLCSMKASIDIATYVRSLIRAIGQTLGEALATLLKNLEKLAKMPSPDDCCAQAHSRFLGSFGSLVSQLCDQIRGVRNPWQHCADISKTDEECQQCCLAFAPLSLPGEQDRNAAARSRCSERCAAKVFDPPRLQR